MKLPALLFGPCVILVSSACHTGSLPTEPVVAPTLATDLKNMPWPKVICDLGTKATHAGRTTVLIEEPQDPRERMEGGSGGPIMLVSFTTADPRVAGTFTTQLISARLLENHDGWPQFEIWSRAGGGSWCRCLYRHSTNPNVRTGNQIGYWCVRVDDFTELEKGARSKQQTTMPGSSDILYFVETRLQ